MTAAQLRVLAAIYAEVTRMEAMRAANVQRAVEGSSPAYGEDDFNYVANRLDELSTQGANT